MWLLAFAILALIIGTDLRKRGLEVSCASFPGSAAYLTAQNANAVGAWICFAGGICLNIAVWSLF